MGRSSWSSLGLAGALAGAHWVLLVVMAGSCWWSRWGLAGGPPRGPKGLADSRGVLLVPSFDDDEKVSRAVPMGIGKT